MFDEATLCFGDQLDSRAVVGLGKFASSWGSDHDRESKMLWWVLLMSLAVLKK